MTSHQKLFLELIHFLAPYEAMWNNEILIFHPHSLGFYKKEWLDLLKDLPLKDLWKIDARLDYSAIKGSELYKLCQDIKNFHQFETINDRHRHQIANNMFFKIKGKKRHEIESLIPLIKELSHDGSISKGIDIGGGVGHFSRIISNQLKVPVYCIDQDSTFIEIGKRIQGRKGKSIEHDIHLINETFHHKNYNVSPLFTNDSLVVGLHTCGPLANELLKTAVENKVRQLINFGCCYGKMNDQDQNISSYAKTHSSFIFSNHALTLATRAHCEMNFQDFLLKKKVKAYRYALHLFMKEKLGFEHFVGVGDSKPELYNQSFSFYAQNKLQLLGISDVSANDLEEFFRREDITKVIWEMFLLNIIRWQFGRLLEMYILLDRCLLLEENGYEVTLKEYFDEKISPRNLGIMAKLK